MRGLPARCQRPRAATMSATTMAIVSLPSNDDVLAKQPHPSDAGRHRLDDGDDRAATCSSCRTGRGFARARRRARRRPCRAQSDQCSYSGPPCRSACENCFVRTATKAFDSPAASPSRRRPPTTEPASGRQRQGADDGHRDAAGQPPRHGVRGFSSPPRRAWQRRETPPDQPQPR